MPTICIIYAPTPLPWLQVKTQRLQVETTLTVRSRNFSFSFSFCHLLIHKLFSKMSPAPAKRMFFGSTQERKLFPLHHAPDRLGNQMSRPEAPHVGPGCYDNHEFGTILYDLQKTPESKKGYGLSARTAARFPPRSKNVTPSPQQYQQDQSQSRLPAPGKAPFNLATQRFKTMSSTAEDSPGPGAYAHDAVTNRKVSWPMCFGSPDWSRLPQLEKKSLRLSSDKAFLKHRGRVAYLSLYY
uniref:Si:ch211-66i15.4 n=1 Tax=Lates calcarifer TaxID=8187 RepID=A0A4W6DEU9_LATCA